MVIITCLYTTSVVMVRVMIRLWVRLSVAVRVRL